MPIKTLLINIVVLISLLGCSKAFSQQGQVENVGAYFRITHGYRSGDTIFPIIRGGSNHGIKEGMGAFAFSKAYTNSDGTYSRQFNNIGYGKVVRVYPDSSVCLINLAKTGSHNDSLLLGDVLMVNIAKPVKTFPNIYLELALRNVYLESINKELPYTLDISLKYDLKKLDSIITSFFVKDLHDAYSQYKDNSSLSTLFTEPFNGGGRFMGKIPLDVVKNASPADVHDFLRWVLAYPGGFIGQNFKLAEKFLGWVVFPGNFTAEDIYKDLFPIYKDRARLNAEIPRYRSSLVEEKLLAAYSDSIKNYYNKKLFGKIDSCREFAWAMTDAVKDTASKASIMLAMAVNKYVDGEHSRSIIYCDSAIYYARQCRAYKTEMEANLQKSEVLFGMNKSADAKRVFTEMQARIKLYGSAMNEGDRNLYTQRGYQFSGWFDYKNGEYGKALQNFAIALHLNNIDRSFSSRRNNALIYKYMGFIYKEQGKTDEALRSFSASELLYDSVGDPKEKAYIWNEVGVVYYNSGKYSEAVSWFERAWDLSKELSLYDNLGYSMSMKANCLWNFNKIDSAILLHREAINTRRDINPLGVAYSWDQLGQLFQVNAYKTYALDAFDSSRAIYEQRKDSSRIQENYINVGLVYHNDENYKKAISYFEKALRSSSKNSSTALFDLGLAWSELDKTKSVSYLKMAERVCDSSKDLVLQYKVLYNLTNIHYKNSDFVKGDISLRKMENLLKEIGTPVRLAMTHALKGVRYEYKSMLDSALFEYEKALVIYDTTSKLDAVNMLASKSNIYISKGDFDESLRVIDLALKYSQDAGSPIGKSMSYGRFGFIYGELGEFDKGLVAIDSALSIFKSSGNNIRYASTLVTRGMLFKDKGEFKQALEDILYADSVYLAEGVETYRGGSLNDAATVYMAQSDYSRAIEYLQASEKFSLGDDKGESYMINRINLSECYYNQKKYKEALDILNSNYPETVKRKFNRVAMSMANILGNIYFEQGDLARARIFKRQAFDLSVKSGSAEEMINAMVYLGKIDLQELKTDSAEIKIRRSLLLGKERGLTGSLWEAYYELGIVFYMQKRYDSAIVYFRSAVDIVEQLAGNIYGGEEARKLYSSDPRKVDLYNKIIASFVAVKDPANASEYALRNSITALNSKYGKDLGFADSTLKADLAKAEDIQRQIRAVNANIAKADTKEKKEALIQTRRILEEGYQNFMDERKEKYRDFDKYLKGGVNPEDLSNYKGGLPDDMAVVSYIINDSLLYKFVVTNSTLEIVTTSLSEDINVQVNEFISALTSPDSGSGTGSLKVRADFADKKKTSKKSFTEVSEKLYDILVADLLPVIGDKKKLCIIPSGKLSNIPFQCLGKKGADGFRFLLEDYRVFYANRLDMFRSKDASDRNISNMAAFGNPDKSLEFAKQEVLDIQKISHAKMVYVEEGATEVKARESLVQNKYVHFATHGTLDYVKPKQSYLTFTVTPGAGDDGRLTIAEIDSMKTGSQYAELVTLSACETARPLAISEDWYVSPANSFLRKKFKTVVASLWKVNDEATGLLMSTFYRNLEKMDKVDALRQAQETVSGDPRYKHPYFWGGFVLYGDWR